MSEQGGSASLVIYVMKFATRVSKGRKPVQLTREEAEAWLDKHCPQWRRSVVRNG